MRIRFRIQAGLLAVALVTQLSACGTIIYPDRRGQIEGKIDPLVAGLDAIGILFLVIPGLIAFGVDFASGAIYLPHGRYTVAPETLQQSIDADGNLDLQRLKALIEERTGHSLPLDDPRLIRHGGSPQQLAAYGLPPAA